MPIEPISFDEVLSAVSTAVEQKNAATNRLLTVQQDQNDRVVRSSQNVMRHAMNAQEQLTRLDAEQANARRLADSGNIVDRFTLIGEQILNPRAYTRQGRTAQRGEISQSLAAQSQIHNVVVSDAAANIASAEARVTAAETRKQMATEEIRSQIETTALFREQLTQSEALRVASLSTKTTQDLDSAIAVGPGKDGKIDIGGLKYTPTELRERRKSLETRETLSRLAPTVTDPEYAAKIDAYHRSILQTYSVDEIRKVREEGGFMPDGTQVQQVTLDGMLASKQAGEADSLQAIQDEYTAQNVLPRQITQAGQLLERLHTAIPENSPLQTHFASLQSETAALVQVANREGLTDGQRRVALERYAKAQIDFYSAADKEATRKAGADKDLKDIYFAQLTGQDPSPEQYREVIVNRLTDDKPIGNIVPGQRATRLKQLQNELTSKIMQEASQLTQQNLFSDTKKTLKEAKREAAEQAITILGSEIANDALNAMQRNSVSIPGHPLYGQMPAQVNAIVNEASATAWSETQRKFDLSDDELARAKLGQPLPGKNLPEIAAYYTEAAYMQEYMIYESMQPGLGSMVADWYTVNSEAAMLQQYKKLDPALQPLIADSIENAIQQTASNWQAAKAQIGLTGARKAADFLTHENDVTFTNAILLQGDVGLDVGQKKLLMDKIIRPAIQVGEQAGFKPAELATFVEKAIQTASPEDADLKRALSIHRRNRLEGQTRFNQWKEAIIEQHSPLRNRRTVLGTKPFFVTRPEDRAFVNNPEGYAKKTVLDWAYSK